MVCPNCGKELAPGTRFCESCGAKIEEQGNTQGGGYYAAPVTPTAAAPVYRQPVTAGGYILRYLINFIPIVGWLIYLVMLFVWAGDKTKEESFNNWAKAQLIIILISVILVVVCMLFFGGAIAAILGSQY